MAWYLTGLVSIDRKVFPRPPYLGRNWRASLAPGVRITKRTKLKDMGHGIVGGREVIIHANRDDVAERAFALIKAAFCVVGGVSEFGPPAFDDFELTRARNVAECRRIQAGPRHRFMGTAGFPRACELAAKASRRQSAVYALAKFKVSVDLYSTYLLDLDPTHTPTLERSTNPEDHIRACYAIVTAYAVIEELGFAVPAGPGRSSSMPDGSWNPAVRADLESVLKSGGVDIAEQFNWNVRGGRTRLEKRRPARLFRNATPAPWARWDVRDLTVDVVDAIGHASWLRSNVAAHRTRPADVRLISAYDVANTQWLARRLLLERLGFWRKWFR
jgi:hypothetical protein